MKDLEAINQYLDQHPDDWDARLLLSDLYEDMGDMDRAQMQRWLVRHHKRPCSLELQKKLDLIPADTYMSLRAINRDSWAWYGSGLIDPSSVVAKDFYTATYWTTRTEAEDDLMHKLLKHPVGFRFVPTYDLFSPEKYDATHRFDS